MRANRFFKKRAVISLGSNIGERESRLTQAVALLQEDKRITILKQTDMLNSKALLYEEQPDFLNMLIEIETSLTPHELLKFCQAAEKKLGRIKRFRYGPREIDIDIVTMDGCIICDETLTLPHPGLKDRGYLKELMHRLDHL